MAAHRQAIPPGLPWQLLSFAAIGIASTLAYGLLFLVLRNGLGAQKANRVATVLRFLLMRGWIFRRHHSR
jgi:putative flippase GtrA